MPTSEELTVRILSDGSARLSPDLAKEGDTFVPFVTDDSIILLRYNSKMDKNSTKVLKVWASNEKAVSMMISLNGTLREMSRKSEDIEGVYRVVRAKNKIIINLLERTENVT